MKLHFLIVFPVIVAVLSGSLHEAFNTPKETATAPALPKDSLKHATTFNMMLNG